MTEQILKTIHKYDMLPDNGCTILCAVSGGADSMAMLRALRELSAQLRITVAAAHFNHKLRGAESDRDERFVAEFCAREEIKLITGSADVALAARGANVEETARRLRYEFLANAADGIGAERIATAHTAGDNAETVILNLLRGTGIEGLGIPPRRGNIIRPLIETGRGELRGYIAERGIEYVEDSSNSDEKYTRNLIRKRILPVFYEINASFERRIAGTSDAARQASEYIASVSSELAESARDVPGGVALKAELFKTHPAVSSRLARTVAGRVGTTLTNAQTQAVLKIAAGTDPSASVSLGNGVRVVRAYSDIEFLASRPERVTFAPREMKLDGETEIPETGAVIKCSRPDKDEIIHKSLNTFYVDYDKLVVPVTVRPRQTGDRIRLNKSRTLKKLFIDLAIKESVRPAIPVIADARGVIAVAGIGADAERVPAELNENTLKIEFRGGVYEG